MWASYFAGFINQKQDADSQAQTVEGHFIHALKLASLLPESVSRFVHAGVSRVMDALDRHKEARASYSSAWITCTCPPDDRNIHFIFRGNYRRWSC